MKKWDESGTRNQRPIRINDYREKRSAEEVAGLPPGRGGYGFTPVKINRTGREEATSSAAYHSRERTPNPWR